MAGSSHLDDPDQERIAIAVQGNGTDVLGMARGVPLAPILLARAAPEHDSSVRQCSMHRLIVHPAKHEDLIVVIVLDDRRHETVLVKGEALRDGNIEGWCGHPTIFPCSRCELAWVRISS